MDMRDVDVVRARIPLPSAIRTFAMVTDDELAFADGGARRFQIVRRRSSRCR